MFTKITSTINDLNFNSITEERKATLQPLIDYIQEKVNTTSAVRINFICTHNSRRSHLSQIWAQTAASFYNIPNVACYSGGTEATALFPKIAETLENTGFQIKTIAEGKNPIYTIKYNTQDHPIIGFSKTYDDAFNPNKDFAAVLTCSSADEGCPFIAGAEKRIPIMFEDPKAFDNTPLQTQKYEERSLQIATDFMYVFSKIKK
ncbi:arsenate reductase [Flavobacterium succinicans]|uniref:Arsenate reductase n=1 Tax=Flavobacterium succinicans TaxID=29536 RepID=A0A1I4UFG5_9FLAO|nr:protein-tyrosine-phosphatase [Flavobacterium succinicans]SFM87665.1 arsenate reductase [Flavobacterium succinicans]